MAQTRMFSLESRQALVTGGSRGIGFAIARALAEAGAGVVIVSLHRESLDKAANLLKHAGIAVETHGADLSDPEAIGDIYADILTKFGAFDILVNSAGITRRGAAHELKLADWRTVIDTNLSSVFALCQAFARQRIAAGKPGKIINIASLMSEAARPSVAAYAASKGGIRQLTRALAVEWAPHAINVNAIGPGFIHTDLTRPLAEDESLDRWVRQRTPMGRWGEPSDLAGAAVFLASTASDFVTGQIIYVDGGWLASL